MPEKEIKFQAPRDIELKSRIVLGLILVLVSIQLALFLWSSKVMSEILVTRQKISEQIAVLKTLETQVAHIEKSISELPSPKKSAVQYRFDTADSQPKLEKDLFLIQSDPKTQISVEFSAAARMGAKGKGMKIAYDFSQALPETGWVGLEFDLSQMALGSDSVLSFALKGDSKAGFSPKLALFVYDGQKQASLPVIFASSFWKRFHFSFSKLAGGIDLSQIKTFRLVIEKPKKTAHLRGTYHLDHFEIRKS